MSNDERNLLAAAGALILVPAVIVVACMWSGYTLALAWGWIIVPTFGLPALSIPQAIGVTMIVSHLAKHVPESKDKVNWGKLFGRLAVAPALFLLATYIVAQFI